MKDLKNKSLIINYTLAGFFLGIILILISIVLDMILKDIAFTNIFRLHQKSITHWLIDASPFILGAAAYLVSHKLANRVELLQQESEERSHHLDKTLHFIEKLKAGDINDDFYTDNENDELASSIIALKESIKKNKEEEEKRKREDEQRSWVNEGLANFGDILRKHTDNTERLSYHLITNLVNYMDANQGGLFLLNDEDEENIFFEQTASYAYGRKKFADKKIPLGEGLIGTCALEKETIFMKDIPETYVEITSGLGKATPKSLLLVPIKNNNKVFGIIEIAAFYPFEDYQISFVEKVAESIASTISNVKMNAKTARLLQESREKTEALASNEEELRQNMEELQATQEEAKKQNKKFMAFANTVNHTLLRAEYNMDGTLQYANTKFLKKLGYESNSEVEGKNISIFINKKDNDWFFNIWNNLKQGGKHFEGNMKHVTKQGKDLWTMATYTCVKNEDGAINKILFLGLDITDQKQQSLDDEGQIEALNRSNIKAEFTPKGEFLDCNPLFIKAFNYETITEFEEKTIFSFIHKDDFEAFKKTRQDVIEMKSFQGEIKTLSKSNDPIWLRCTFTAVKNMYDEVAKIILIAQNITSKKEMDIEAQKQIKTQKENEEKLIQSEKNLKTQLKELKSSYDESLKSVEEEKFIFERFIDNIFNPVIISDTKGNIEFINQAMEDITKFTKKELSQMALKDMFPKSIVEKNDIIKGIILEGDVQKTKQTTEVPVLSKDKKEHMVSIYFIHVKAYNNYKFVAFLTSGVDAK